jgi:methionine-rich copper-binding protein CopC
MRHSTYAAAALLLVSSGAHAHSQLTSSTPADKASLASAPTQVVLHFSEPVRVTALSVTPSGGERQNFAGIPTEFLKDFTIAAPVLGAGEYAVSWRALAPDSHVMTGTFTFSVGATGSASHAEHAASHEQP